MDTDRRDAVRDGYKKIARLYDGDSHPSHNESELDDFMRLVDTAMQRVPQAEFLLSDMTALDFDESTFDGIISAYAVFHVPRAEHAVLFKGFHRMMKKGGALLISIGTTETDGVCLWEEFQNVPMFWSYYPPPKTVELLESAGFELLFTRDVEIPFAGNLETHHWILARAL